MLSDESSLIEAARRGDAHALGTLMERHLPGLRAFVRLRLGRLLRGRESDSDVVQSVCREVLGRMDDFQHGGDAGFKRWLYRTALRKISNRREYWEAARRDARREVAPPSDSASGEDKALLDSFRTLATPSRQAAAHEELARIETAFAQLPSDYQEVITLARIAGLPHAEIAEEMGRSQDSVRNLLFRAMARFGTLLDQGANDTRAG